MVAPDPTAERQACLQALAGLRRGEAAPMAAWLRAHLARQVLPFWTRHAFDARGGLSTCLADDGRVVSPDKWVWSQWRAVWVFSRLHRHVDPDPAWLERARGIIEFCRRDGWDARARGWALVLDAAGRPVRGAESIYTDAFAVYGLREYHAATGDAAALDLARQTAEAALDKLAGPVGEIPHFPYPIPAGAKPHGLPMMWSLVLAELGATTRDERHLRAAARFAGEVFRDFHRPDRDVVLEFVRGDGTELATAEGRAVVPGHAIEDMWFQVHVADLLGTGSGRVAEALRLVLRHLALGWDHAHGGGLLLAVDAEGREPVGWKFADTKLWWPQTEALYATLLGWSRTREPVFLEWYARLWDVCLAHYVDWRQGEWRQKLDRHFRPMAATIALPVKDPFHLPRSLILQIELLESLSSAAPANHRDPS